MCVIKKDMKIKDALLYCPDCGHRLEFDYSYKDERTGEERTVYYCPEGDEQYYFQVIGKYLYCICQWTCQKYNYGLASQLED